MNKNLMILMVLFVLGIATKISAQVTAAIQEIPEFYGEKFDASKAISFDDMIKKLGKKKDLEVTVKGKVMSVCQAKGCWMNVTSISGNSEDQVFVKFKDYAFFMPLDLAGGEVVMKGKIFTEETSIEELKHYAEDAGKSKEEIAAIKEPQKELKFLASGVKILKQ